MRTPLRLLFTATALFGFLAIAQDGDFDAPSRAARLSYVSGTVSFQPGSVEDWVPAELNRPLTTGDRLWTESGARAEMHIGSAAFRLNGRTNFSFLNLDDRTAQIQMSLGSLSVRIRRLEQDEVFEIDTPQAAFSLLRPGEYRIEVNEQGDATILTVRGGEAEATAGGQSFNVNPREQVRVSGGADGVPPAFDRRPAPAGDAFDIWCQDRDRREDMSQSARYVSHDTPGYADLDANGVWSEVPEYGPVWVPSRMPGGWAPYRYGHWAWIVPWGWTWIDDAPWGYAPFHYGRWVFVAGGWGWVPGPVGVRPVYAPALVAWVGGANFGVGISIGGPAVGWFPLGPREVWVPGYRYSPRYIERVNVTNTVIVNRTVFNNVNVTNVTYVNRRVVGAVTAVPQGALASGRPIGAVAVRVSPDQAGRVQMMTHAGVVPEREAVLSGRTAVRFAPPVVVANRTVVTRAAPPPRQVEFSRQQTELRNNPGRPLDPGTMRRNESGQGRPGFRPAGVPERNRAAAPAPAPVPAANNPRPQRGGGLGGGNPPAQPQSVEQNTPRPQRGGGLGGGNPPAQPQSVEQNTPRPAPRDRGTPAGVDTNTPRPTPRSARLGAGSDTTTSPRPIPRERGNPPPNPTSNPPASPPANPVAPATTIPSGDNRRGPPPSATPRPQPQSNERQKGAPNRPQPKRDEKEKPKDK